MWPRVYLDLKGCIKIRARSGEEALRFLAVFVDLAMQGHLRDYSGWRGGEVKTGALHRLRLEWDERKVLRVVAKIAYGVAWLKVRPEVTERDPWSCLREYVVGEAPNDAQSSVREVHEPGSIMACRFWAPPNDYLVSAPVRPHEEGAMKYLCLIYIEEKKVDAISKSEFHALVDAAPDDEEETARDAREEMGT